MELSDHALTIGNRWSCRDSTRIFDDQDDQKGHLEEDEIGAIRKNQQGLWSKSYPIGGGWLEAEGPPEFKPNHRRCIVHFDIDCFYAQVEEVLNPSLRGKPIGIQQKYLMVTCNYVARSLGVRKMKSVAEAKKICPSLILLDGEDLTHYREASEAIFSYISSMCGPMVQRLGMDEIFADVTEIIDSALERPSTEATVTAKAEAAPLREPGSVEEVDSVGGQQNPLPANSHWRTIDFTGHLYAPGCGGTLLEAQTGLEISLQMGIGDDDGGCTGKRELSKGTHEAFSVCVREREETRDDSLTEQVISKEDVSYRSTGDAAERKQAEENDSCARVALEGVSAWTGAKRKFSRGLGADAACRCGCLERLAATSAFAECVRKGLLETVGYTCSAGIGCSKATAKLAGELHKPAQQTTILPEHAMSMMLQLPIRKLPGCGHSTSTKIKTELGITETRQLRDCPWPLLVRTVGLKLAKVLFLLCRGEDQSPVVPSVRPKTMSDEDSFKRGTVTSRNQVELHIRRLSAALLIRAGERVRLHQEAPEILRVSLRRASKGYGSRVSRQCPISGGFAAAWGAAGDVTESRAGESRPTSSESRSLTAVSGSVLSSACESDSATEVLTHQAINPLPAMVGNESPRAASTGYGRGPVDIRPGIVHRGVGAASVTKCLPENEKNTACLPATPSTPRVLDVGGGASLEILSAKQREHRRAAAEEALHEVVRLAMGMVDKMCSPGERLDLTLLSVGLTGFRALGGVTQAGIARFLAPPLENKQTPGITDRVRDSTPPMTHCATSGSLSSERRIIRDGNSAQANTMAALEHSHVEGNPVELLVVSGLRSLDDRGDEITIADGGSASGDSGGNEGIGTKKRRLQPMKNPYYRPQQSDQRQLEESAARAGEWREAAEDDASSEAGGAGEDWGDADVLVVEEGGRSVRGRGRLDWCWSCRAYVLQSDMEEHSSSSFHRASLRVMRISTPV